MLRRGRARATWISCPCFGARGTSTISSRRPRRGHHELDRASYLLTFNEPEFSAQANISPRRAAQLWPILVEIAQNYSLELVAPCVSSGVHGERWWGAVHGLHGECEFDYGGTGVFVRRCVR